MSNSEKLEKELAESRAASQNAISNTIGGRAARPRPEAQQRRSNGRRAQVPGRPRHDPRPTRTHQAASRPTRTRPCTPVEGKRKIWGTWRTTTVDDITRTIHTLTSIKTGLTVKRKYKTRRSYPHTVSRWWFVISGEENLLRQLQDEWPTVTDSNQTKGKWSLQPLLCYDPEATSETSNQTNLSPPESTESSLSSEHSTSNISTHED